MNKKIIALQRAKVQENEGQRPSSPAPVEKPAISDGVLQTDGSAHPITMSLSPSRQTIFEIAGTSYTRGKLLGHGGEGLVFRATHSNSEKALRIQEFNDKLKFDQALYAANLHALVCSHPKIATVYAIGSLSSDNQTAEGKEPLYRLVTVMDLAPGKDLTTLISESSKCVEQFGPFIIKQVYEVVRFLQDSKVCHRDLTPQNIMVDKEGNIQVIDFGTALRSDDIENHSPMVTRGYSPIFPFNAWPDWKDVDPYAIGTLALVLGLKYDGFTYAHHIKKIKAKDFSLGAHETSCEYNKILATKFIKSKSNQYPYLCRVINHFLLQKLPLEDFNLED